MFADEFYICWWYWFCFKILQIFSSYTFKCFLEVKIRLGWGVAIIYLWDLLQRSQIFKNSAFSIEKLLWNWAKRSLYLSFACHFWSTQAFRNQKTVLYSLIDSTAKNQERLQVIAFWKTAGFPMVVKSSDLRKHFLLNLWCLSPEKLQMRKCLKICPFLRSHNIA